MKKLLSEREAAWVNAVRLTPTYILTVKKRIFGSVAGVE